MSQLRGTPRRVCCTDDRRVVWSRSPQASGHQGPVSWKTIFPHTKGGEGMVSGFKRITFIVQSDECDKVKVAQSC